MNNKPVESESVDAPVMASDGEEDDLKTTKRPGAAQMQGLVGKTGINSSKVAARCCQADKCGTDLAVAKPYHRRHKVCEVHAKAQVVLVAGITQRFCQQCSRFHEVTEFDESKRSCRRRLAGHNERRRKSPAAAAGSDQVQDMSASRKAGMVCGRVDESSGRYFTSLQDENFRII